MADKGTCLGTVAVSGCFVAVTGASEAEIINEAMLQAEQRFPDHPYLYLTPKPKKLGDARIFEVWTPKERHET